MPIICEIAGECLIGVIKCPEVSCFMKGYYQCHIDLEGERRHRGEGEQWSYSFVFLVMKRYGFKNLFLCDFVSVDFLSVHDYY